jgi:uncharacterized membrane protein
MDELAIARALHVVGVVVWIGGVWMVTTIVLPAARRSAALAGIVEAIEWPFSRHARIATLLVGATGFYMVQRFELWDRFKTAEFWWMHAMVGIWLFSLILFVLEPLFLHRWFEERARDKPASTLALVQRAHWVLLALSIITIVGAVAGSHGFSFG